MAKYTLTPKAEAYLRALALFDKEFDGVAQGDECRADVRALCWGWFHAGYKARDAEDRAVIQAGDIG
jgi:hypothetical protein